MSGKQAGSIFVHPRGGSIGRGRAFLLLGGMLWGLASPGRMSQVAEPTTETGLRSSCQDLRPKTQDQNLGDFYGTIEAQWLITAATAGVSGAAGGWLCSLAAAGQAEAAQAEAKPPLAKTAKEVSPGEDLITCPQEEGKPDRGRIDPPRGWTKIDPASLPDT